MIFLIEKKSINKKENLFITSSLNKAKVFCNFNIKELNKDSWFSISEWKIDEGQINITFINFKGIESNEEPIPKKLLTPLKDRKILNLDQFQNKFVKVKFYDTQKIEEGLLKDNYLITQNFSLFFEKEDVEKCWT